MRVAVGAPMSNNHPNGNSSPEPNQTAAQQTHGVSHDLPRRSPSGRRRAHPSSQTSQTSQTGQTSQTQAPRPRNTHTTVAIKKARHTPSVNLHPSPTTQRHRKPSGYHMACRGVARQGEDGRTHHHFISLISLISLMQASRPRNTHTAAAIKNSQRLLCTELES